MAKVLVVDDHAVNRELIVALLRYAGHESVEAADGNVALEQVRTHRPDLVICDILMPTMDGYEFVRQLRGDRHIAHTEVVFYTATFMEREARSLAASCGVSNVLIKPCEPQEILRTVEQALAHAKAGEPMPDPAEFDRDHLRLLTDTLAQKVGELESANLRLSALTDLNLQLASERDPHVLLDKVCRSARDLLGARYAVLAVRDKSESDSIHLSTWGLAAAQAEPLQRLDIDAGIPGQVMGDGQARRFAAAQDAALPANCPPVRCGLVAPVVSLHRTYGWILLADKLGADAFTADDERLLVIHAAQAGRIYENGSLYNEIKRTASELIVANETLEQRVKLRTAELHDMIEGLESFNRSVSHDLRGPLGGIAGAARLARERMAEQDNEQVNRLLLAIAAQAETTGQLVNSLLALARTGEAELSTRRVDMNALVCEVIEALQHGRGSGPLPVVAGPLAEVDADPDLARQVFMNLIGNALKFSSNAPSQHVEVGIAGSPPGTVFFVRDNGVGFDAEQATRLFRPFHRLHGNRFEGSGVGLSIVKRIIDRHGGKVWAEGFPHRGATFFFTFGEAPSRLPGA